jgi:hypothetical protein
VIAPEAIGHIELGTVNVPTEPDSSEGQAAIPRDVVAEALATALERASAAGEWAVGRHTLSPGIVKPKALALDRAV